LPPTASSPVHIHLRIAIDALGADAATGDRLLLRALLDPTPDVAGGIEALHAMLDARGSISPPNF
jgi:hypothetical protein